MATLVLSSAWAQGGRTRFEIGEGGLHDIIKSFAAANPNYSKRLVDDAGEPRTYYNIYINDEAVLRHLRETAQVRDEDTVTIIPPLAGG